MRITILALTVVAALAIATSAFAQTTGSIAGCLTNELNEGLPRATVSASAPDLRRTTLADERGCYEFQDLPSNAYRVTARLQGFDNVTRDRVQVSPGQVQRVDFTMPISTICDCPVQPTTLGGLYDNARAVAYVRILPPDNQRLPPRGYFAQTAEAMEVFKRHATGGPTNRTIRFLQSQASGAPEPYHPGQELVLFLFWWPEENIFSDGGFPDTVRVVFVQAGRIMDAPAQLKSYVGAPIGGLLADLRKLTPR